MKDAAAALALTGAPDTAAPRADRDAAVREVVRLAGARCFAIAYDLLRDRAEAEDAVQEALARTCERYQEVRDPSLLAGWVYRVLVNLCMRTLRRRRLFSLFALRRAAEATFDTPSFDPPVARSIDARRLLASVDRLPPMQRAAIVLRYGHDQAIDEVAALLGVRPETAKTHIKRGLERLRRELDR